MGVPTGSSGLAQSTAFDRRTHKEGAPEEVRRQAPPLELLSVAAAAGGMKKSFLTDLFLSGS
jgi:hypothetical protein